MYIIRMYIIYFKSNVYYIELEVGVYGKNGRI